MSVLTTFLITTPVLCGRIVDLYFLVQVFKLSKPFLRSKLITTCGYIILYPTYPATTITLHMLINRIRYFDRCGLMPS
jgi:hypothetical protein